MPAYGNAATILNFPDYYASNKIAEPKVLSGGISTGNWGKGAGLPGTRTSAQAIADNTAFLKGYNLDAVPEGLQQNADMTKEVLNMYADLRAVHAGFAKKGINLGAINPADPIQVEAFSIYNNLAKEYVNKLNMVKQGAINQKIIADKQAGNANLIPMQLDDTRPITQADVLATTPVATPSFIEKWNTEGRTSAKSEAEYNQRLMDYKRTIDNIDMFGQMGGQSPQTVEFWKSQVLAPTPFTPEAANPLEDMYLKAKIFAANSSAELSQARKKAIEDNGAGGSNAPVNALYRDAGGFINYAKGEIKKDPSYLGAVPYLNIADQTTIAREDLIDANGNAKDPKYDLTLFGQGMSIPKSAGNGSITNILLRTGANGEPIYYIVEESSMPKTEDGKVVQKPAYTFRKITNANNVIKSGSLAGYPIELQTLATGAKSVQQVNGNEQYGGDEDVNFMGQESSVPATSGKAPVGIGKSERPGNPWGN